MKLYDVYFKPAMSGIVCVEANSAEEAMEKVMNGEHAMGSAEILQRIKYAMECDGYELEVIDAEYAGEMED